MATKIKKIIPHLWFDTQAIEAAKYYVSVFPNSKVLHTKTIESPYSPGGKFDVVSFELSGNRFTAISAGPIFKFNEAVSFMVYCDTQEEIDYFWQKLTEGGEEQPCGWCKDKFGLSWQVVPSIMESMLQDEDSNKVNSVMQELLKMSKINLNKLVNAY